MAQDSDADLLQEELCALGAIFGDDCSIHDDQRSLVAWVPSKNSSPRYELRVRFPCEGYPSEQPPEIDIHAPHLSDDVREKTIDELYDLFLPGEVAVFNMIELLKERFDVTWGDDDVLDDHDMHTDSLQSGEQEQKPSDAMDEAMCRMSRVIVTGEPYTERKSAFQAHVAPVASKDDVRAMVAVLLLNGKIARATHNMWAFRIRIPDKGAFLQDCDDDGEAAAGSRLLHLLQVTGAEGVCVVVSRWFGGTLLGPSRFSIINNTARSLLAQQGYVSVPSKRPSRH